MLGYHLDITKQSTTSREEFSTFAKKSPSVKEYLDGERRKGVDKAELAFKVGQVVHSRYNMYQPLSCFR